VASTTMALAMASGGVEQAASGDKVKVMPMHGRGTSTHTKDMAVQASMHAAMGGGDMNSGAVALVVNNPILGPGMPSSTNTQYCTGSPEKTCMGKTMCMSSCMEELHTRLWMLKCMGKGRRRITRGIHTHLQA
jgi:hypothetical protein